MSIAIHVTNNLESLQRYEISAAFLELLDAIVLDQHRVLWFGESPNGPKVGFDSFAAPSKKIIKSIARTAPNIDFKDSRRHRQHFNCSMCGRSAQGAAAFKKCAGCIIWVEGQAEGQAQGQAVAAQQSPNVCSLSVDSLAWS